MSRLENRIGICCLRSAAAAAPLLNPGPPCSATVPAVKSRLAPQIHCPRSPQAPLILESSPLHTHHTLPKSQPKTAQPHISVQPPRTPQNSRTRKRIERTNQGPRKFPGGWASALQGAGMEAPPEAATAARAPATTPHGVLAEVPRPTTTHAHSTLSDARLWCALSDRCV